MLYFPQKLVVDVQVEVVNGLCGEFVPDASQQHCRFVHHLQHAQQHRRPVRLLLCSVAVEQLDGDEGAFVFLLIDDTFLGSQVELRQILFQQHHLPIDVIVTLPLDGQVCDHHDFDHLVHQRVPQNEFNCFRLEQLSGLFRLRHHSDFPTEEPELVIGTLNVLLKEDIKLIEELGDVALQKGPHVHVVL